jgi:hypothetical protein
MERVDNTLRLSNLQGVGSKDPEHNQFFCEIIWSTKNVQDEAMKIAQLEITFIGHALVWYMKFQSIKPKIQDTNLA